MADWSQLPYDLTALIASHLYTIGEFILFSAVCRSWQLVYLNRDWISAQPNPWLMLGHYYAHGIPTRQFINLSIMKVYRIPLPEAHGHQCWGTCHGWIVTIGPGFAICLLNPVTRVPINLPPLPDLRSTVSYKHNWFEAIQRATVVKFRGSFLTTVIYGLFCRLAFAIPGDNEWTLLSNSTPLSSVVCFEGRLWALSLDGSLKILDIDSPSIVDFASPPEDVKGMNLFLVESSDKLLVVSQRYHFISLKFRVYNFDTLTNEWSVIHELGNNVILMDGYNCYSVYAFGYMERNCIYYAGQNFKMLSLDRDRYRTDCCITRYNIKFSSSYVYRIADYSHPSNVAMWMVATL